MKIKITAHKLLMLIAVMLIIQLVNAQIPLTLTLTGSNYNGSNISCIGAEDGTITANPAGGIPPYKYQWSTGETTSAISGLKAGYYRLGMIDQWDYYVEAEIYLNEPGDLKIDPNVTVYANGYNISCYNCFNGTINLTIYGGTAPFTYLWSDNSTNKNRYNLAPGNHDVIVTDANGCITRSEAMYLNQPERSDWTITGNSGSNPLSSFIGTTDNVDLKFRTNNLERLSLNANGDIKMNALKSDSITNKYRYVYVDDNGKLKANYIPYCSTSLPPNPWLLGGNIIDVNNPQSQYLGSCNWADVVFGTSTLERMRLTAIGRLGIGRTNPDHILDVQGQGRFRNYLSDNIAGTTDIGFAYGAGFLNSSATLLINSYDDHDVVIGSSANSSLISNAILKLNNGLKFNNNIGGAGILQVDANGNVSTTPNGNYGVGLWTKGSNATSDDIINTNQNNVGIGTTTYLLASKFQVGGSVLKVSVGDAFNSTTWYTGYIGFNASKPTSSGNWFIESNGINLNAASALIADASGNLNFVTLPSFNGGNLGYTPDDTYMRNATKMTVRADGKVTIGNTQNTIFDPTTPYKLYVTGGIRTERVKVDVPGIWSDYVFDTNYKMMSLDELNSYLFHNKHLPDIPTETEVCNNGFDVAEMQSLILKKVEELTLYVIQLKKENDDLKTKYNELENK
jgi:hypothetical protein